MFIRVHLWLKKKCQLLFSSRLDRTKETGWNICVMPSKNWRGAALKLKRGQGFTNRKASGVAVRRLSQRGLARTHFFVGARTSGGLSESRSALGATCPRSRALSEWEVALWIYILLFGDERCDMPALQLPHPRSGASFVLRPLLDVLDSDGIIATELEW
jgi:hypothetical protein